MEHKHLTKRWSEFDSGDVKQAVRVLSGSHP